MVAPATLSPAHIDSIAEAFRDVSEPADLVVAANAFTSLRASASQALVDGFFGLFPGVVEASVLVSRQQVDLQPYLCATQITLDTDAGTSYSFPLDDDFDYSADRISDASGVIHDRDLICPTLVSETGASSFGELLEACVAVFCAPPYPSEGGHVFISRTG